MNVTLKTAAHKSNFFAILPTIAVGRERGSGVCIIAIWLNGYFELEVINNKK